SRARPERPSKHAHLPARAHPGATGRRQPRGSRGAAQSTARAQDPRGAGGQRSVSIRHTTSMVTTTDKVATKQRVFEQATAANVRFVSLQFTDIMGVVKNVHIPFHKFGDAVDHGLWFDGSSIEGFARIHESDMFLDPDLDTFGIIPWERDEASSTAKVICDVYTPNGEPFAGDPRGVLRRQLERASSLNFRNMTGPELEFFMLRRTPTDGFDPDSVGVPNVEPLPHDQAGYFDLTTDEAANVRKEMVEALEELGIVVEASHHEVAIGQHE